MGKRTNTAQWIESTQRWRVSVQKDGVRKQFYSSKPGRTGQREANAKADAWLDDGINAHGSRVSEVGKLWLHNVEATTSTSNYRPLESRWRCWVLPAIGNVKIEKLTEQALQDIINQAYAAGKSRKTLQLLCADLRNFCKFCRKSKLSTFIPEELTIPAGARYKGKAILQPSDLVTLFSTDTTVWCGKTIRDEYINAYRFQVLTGLRPGELIGLKWADISGNTVRIGRAVNIQGQVTTGKNDNALRAFQPVEKACFGIKSEQAFAFGMEKIEARKRNHAQGPLSGSSPERDFSVSTSKWPVSLNSWQQI